MKFPFTPAVALLAALSVVSTPAALAREDEPKIRLVLQVTVDGLRADLLTGVATTLAALLGMSAPASAQGTVLPEVFPHAR